MKRAIWVHQFSQQSEQTTADYANTLLPRGIDTIYAKAMDGTSWMGDFYSHPLAPTNAQRWAQIRSEFLDVGLTLTAWVVPRSSASEADAHTDCNPFVVDFEYQYAGFWTGSDAQAWAYFDKLRESIADGYGIAVAPDPRQINRDYAGSLIAGLTGYLPQTYWTDFQRPALEVLNSARNNMAGMDPFAPILPYNGTPADVQAALEWCVAQGCESVSMWRMGVANAAQLDAFAQRVEGEQDQGAEEPMPDCDYGWQDKKPVVVETAGQLLSVKDQFLAEANRKGGPRVKEIRRLATAELQPRVETILD